MPRCHDLVMHVKKYFNFCLVVSIVLFSAGCNSDTTLTPLFRVLDQSQTGLNFSNKLAPTAEMNMFKYMYFYNGAGVGVGDFNNDG